MEKKVLKKAVKEESKLVLLNDRKSTEAEVISMNFERKKEEVPDKDYTSDITPVLNKVLVQAIKEDDRTVNGLIITSDLTGDTEKYEIYAKVLNVNKGSNCPVKKGDLIILSPNASPAKIVLAKDFVVYFIDEHNILGTITEEVAEFMRRERISEKSRTKIDIIH